MRSKLQLLVTYLRQKRRFTLKEAEEVAARIANEHVAPNLVIEAVAKLAKDEGVDHKYRY